MAEVGLSGNVVRVKDGDEALRYLLADSGSALRDLKLVLLDVKMPNIDGIQELHQIKTNPSLQHIPIVLLTSSSEERDLIESYSLGVNSYITTSVIAACDQTRQALYA